MTTQAEKDAILAATRAGLDGHIKDGYQTLLKLIRQNTAPREAVNQVLKSFPAQYADILAPAFTAVLHQSVGGAQVLAMEVSGMKLSERLYQESKSVSATVTRLVNEHLLGFQQAREMALRIYEGYDYNPIEALKPRSMVLPRYLRRIMENPLLANDINIAFTKIRASSLKTPALKAAYLELLNKVQEGPGSAALQKKLDVAFHEKLRYFANRIAQTELHRAWSDKQTEELLNEPEIEFVEWRLSGSHSGDCICVLFARQNQYGLGPGIYPKHLAPKPSAHPFCRCSLVPRIDIPLGAKWKERKGADRAFLNSLTEHEAARVMGSRAKLQSVLKGKRAIDVFNRHIDPFYHVKLTNEEAIKPLDLPPPPDSAPPVPIPGLPTAEKFWNSDTDAGRWHSAAFGQAPVFIKRAIQNVGDPLEVKQTKNFKGAYSHPRGYLEMGTYTDKNNLEHKAVWRHEFGHFVDRELGTQRALGTYLSSSKEFKSAIQSDARAIKADAMHNLSRVIDREKYDSLTAFYEKSRSDFIDLGSNSARETWLANRYKAAGLNYEEFKAAMKQSAAFPELLEGVGLLNRYREIIDGFDKKDFQKMMDAMIGSLRDKNAVEETRQTLRKGVLNNLSDLVGSATKNNVSGLKSGFGHKDAYYRQAAHMSYTEVFANLFDYYGSNNATVIQIIEHFMPKTAAIFKKGMNNE